MQSLSYTDQGVRLIPVAVSRGRSSALVLCTALTLILLAFIPLVAPEHPVESAAQTKRGFIEFGLIIAGLFILSGNLKLRRELFIRAFSPAFLLVSIFCLWSILSSAWSPNAMLTIGKSAELWCITLAAALAVSTCELDELGTDKIRNILAISLLLVIFGLVLSNAFIWGEFLPDTGNRSLPIDLIDEEPTFERSRLILAYAHPLLTSDLIAVALIVLISSSFAKAWKLSLGCVLLWLMWLADGRGPMVALGVTLTVMLLVAIRGNWSRARLVTLVGSVLLSIALFFRDEISALFAMVIKEDIYTLNSRTEVWAKSFEYIAESPLIGYGYYASRYLLIPEFFWAGHAHNSFVEVMLTTGLIGVMSLFAFVAYAIRAVFRTTDILLIGVTIYCLIQGMLNPLLFVAGLPMFVLTLCLMMVEISPSKISVESLEAH